MSSRRMKKKKSSHLFLSSLWTSFSPFFLLTLRQADLFVSHGSPVGKKVERESLEDGQRGSRCSRKWETREAREKKIEGKEGASEKGGREREIHKKGSPLFGERACLIPLGALAAFPFFISLPCLTGAERHLHNSSARPRTAIRGEERGRMR